MSSDRSLLDVLLQKEREQEYFDLRTYMLLVCAGAGLPIGTALDYVSELERPTITKKDGTSH